MGKWIWKHFIVQLFWDLLFSQHILILSCYHLKSSVVMKTQKWGFFCEQFLLYTIRHCIHLDPVTFAGLCSRFRVQPVLWDGVAGLPGFARRDIVQGLIAGLSQCLWGMFAIPHHGLTSCYNLPYFCVLCEFFFSLRQCVCIKPLAVDESAWN